MTGSVPASQMLQKKQYYTKMIAFWTAVWYAEYRKRTNRGTSSYAYCISCVCWIVSVFRILGGRFPALWILAAVIFFVLPSPKRRELRKKIAEKRYHLVKIPCINKEIVLGKYSHEDDSHYLVFNGPYKLHKFEVLDKVYNKIPVGTEFCFVFLENEVEPFVYYILLDTTLDDDLRPLMSHTGY